MYINGVKNYKIEVKPVFSVRTFQNIISVAAMLTTVKNSESAFRIGKKLGEKPRPLVVVFNTNLFCENFSKHHLCGSYANDCVKNSESAFRISKKLG